MARFTHLSSSIWATLEDNTWDHTSTQPTCCQLLSTHVKNHCQIDQTMYSIYKYHICTLHCIYIHSLEMDEMRLGKCSIMQLGLFHPWNHFREHRSIYSPSKGRPVVHNPWSNWRRKCLEIIASHAAAWGTLAHREYRQSVSDESSDVQCRLLCIYYVGLFAAFTCVWSVSMIIAGSSHYPGVPAELTTTLAHDSWYSHSLWWPKALPYSGHSDPLPAMPFSQEQTFSMHVSLIKWWPSKPESINVDASDVCHKHEKLSGKSCNASTNDSETRNSISTDSLNMFEDGTKW